MDWTDALLGGLVGGGTFLAVLLVFKRLRGVDGMGFGDVKLMLMLGVLCGPLGLPLSRWSRASRPLPPSCSSPA